MPKRTPGRTIYDEDNLAARISHERRVQGWSLDGLAKRMTDAGCPIHATMINKVETPDPKTGKRRRVPIAELLAYAEVFGVGPLEMLQPPELATQREFANLLREWDKATREALTAAERERAAWARVQTYARDHRDSAGDPLHDAVRGWAARHDYLEPNLAGDAFLAEVLGDPDARARRAQLFVRPAPADDLEGDHDG